jgi:hypothetical protein
MTEVYHAPGGAPAMMSVEMPAGKTLVILGLVLVGAGLLVMLGARLPFRLGRLPGDIQIRGKHSFFYFPLATCALLSLLLSIVLWLIGRR